METKTKTEETVTISKSRYQVLLSAESWVAALNAAGVDNWQGYDHACELHEAAQNFQSS